MIKEPQRFEKNRELYSKAVNSKQSNFLNTTTNNSKRTSFLFISSIFSPRLYRFSRDQLLSKPNNSDGIGDEGAAAQHCFPPSSDCHPDNQGGDLASSVFFQRIQSLSCLLAFSELPLQISELHNALLIDHWVTFLIFRRFPSLSRLLALPGLLSQAPEMHHAL